MLKITFKNKIRNALRGILKKKCLKVLYDIVRSIIKNDFFGMASEMGFILLAGFFTFLLFLMSVFGWMGNKAYMEPIMLVLSNMVPHQAMELIESVLNQTYSNIEIFVVDDNNPETDARHETEKTMEAYRENERVTYLQHDKNRNGSAARNTG